MYPKKPESIRQLREDVLCLEQIPPLSTTATRLLEIATDPELDVNQLAGVIEQDPPLTARILGLANSAFFGQANPVVTVEEAIIRVLGLNMVRSLALSMALAGSFETGACPAFRLDDYWLKALATAALARELALAVKDEQAPPDLVYLCGLLHNLGEILLVHLRPDDMQRVFTQHEKQPDSDLITLQESVIGTNERVAGEWLTMRWHLPTPVVQVIGQLGMVELSGEYASLVSLVRAARRGVDQLRVGQALALQLDGLDSETVEHIVEDFQPRYSDLVALAGLLA